MISLISWHIEIHTHILQPETIGTIANNNHLDIPHKNHTCIQIYYNTQVK